MVFIKTKVAKYTFIKLFFKFNYANRGQDDKVHLGEYFWLVIIAWGR